jgi:hypothetical protein
MECASSARGLGKLGNNWREGESTAKEDEVACEKIGKVSGRSVSRWDEIGCEKIGIVSGRLVGCVAWGDVACEKIGKVGVRSVSDWDGIGCENMRKSRNARSCQTNPCCGVPERITTGSTLNEPFALKNVRTFGEKCEIAVEILKTVDGSSRKHFCKISNAICHFLSPSAKFPMPFVPFHHSEINSDHRRKVTNGIKFFSSAHTSSCRSKSRIVSTHNTGGEIDPLCRSNFPFIS